MGWTYGNDPNAGGTDAQKRDAVRFLIQDTNTSRQLVSNEEITFLLANEPNVWMAAAAAADVVVTKGGSVKSKSVGDLSVSYDVTFYEALAKRLRLRGAGYRVPTAGGISIDDMKTLTDNPDWPKPNFEIGMNDNDRVGTSQNETSE